MDIMIGVSIGTFVMVAIMAVTQYIDSEVPKVSDVLALMNILTCYEIKVYRDRKRLKYNDLIKYINSPVRDYQLKNGILYIEIY